MVGTLLQQGIALGKMEDLAVVVVVLIQEIILVGPGLRAVLAAQDTMTQQLITDRAEAEAVIQR